MISYANSPPNRRPGIDSVAREQSSATAVHLIVGCKPRRRRDLPDEHLGPFSATSRCLSSRSSAATCVPRRLCKNQDVFTIYQDAISRCVHNVSRRFRNVSRRMHNVSRHLCHAYLPWWVPGTTSQHRTSTSWSASNTARSLSTTTKKFISFFCV